MNGDNCIVYENFTASIGDLMVANIHLLAPRSIGDLMVANIRLLLRYRRASKRIFATIKSPIDAVKFSNTIQLSPNSK
jgi:hypothetical protein